MTCPIEIVDNFCAVKGPGEVLDYYINYATTVLNLSDPPDQISSSDWAIEPFIAGADLTIDSDSFVADDGTTVWVSGGGKLGTFHRLVNTIVTTGGRTHVRTILLWIQNR